MHDKEFQLGELISILSGFPFDSELFTDDPGQPLIRIRDLLSAEIKTYYSGPFDKRYVVDNGEILIGMDGDFNVIRWTKGPALLNQRVCLVKSASQELDESFLFWLLGPKVESIHKTTPQTTVKHLSVNDLKGLTVRIPERVHQQKIAQILDTLDTQIQKTDALIAKLEKIKEGLLHDLLTRGVSQNGQLRPTPEQAPELYKESALGLIPKEWQAEPIDSLVTKVSSGAALKTHEFATSGVGVIAKSDVTSSKFINISTREQFVPKRVAAAYSKSLVSSSCVIVSLRDLVPSAPTVGMGSKFKGRGEYLLAQGTYGLYFNETMLLSDLFVEITRLPWFRSLAKVLAVGSTQVHVRSTEYLKIPIPKPPLDEQFQIRERIDSLDTELKTERRALQKLQQIKLSLADDLLTGKIRVTPLLKDAV